MTTRVATGMIAAALTFAVGACGGTTQQESEPATPAADASHAEHATASRVFFVQPTDGATIGREANLGWNSIVR